MRSSVLLSLTVSTPPAPPFSSGCPQVSVDQASALEESPRKRSSPEDPLALYRRVETRCTARAGGREVGGGEKLRRSKRSKRRRCIESKRSEGRL